MAFCVSTFSDRKIPFKMPVKKRKPLAFLEKLRMIKNAGLSNVKPLQSPQAEDPVPFNNLEQRIKQILELYRLHHNNPAKMIFFVMYDIEDHKIRHQIAKYLIRKGCIRVQKSIFLAQTHRERFQEIYNTIKEVQEIYDNNDSVFLIPVSVDEIRAMKIIGQQIDLDLILENRNTLFF